MLHTMVRFLGSGCMSMSMSRGEVPRQTPQMTTWIRGQMGMTELESPDTSRHLGVLPGCTALKARVMAMVLARMVETATVNTVPNATCRRMQVAVLGWEAQEEGDEQDVAESPVTGLDYGGALVPHKEPQNHSYDDREAKRHTGQGHPPRILKGQEGHNLGKAEFLSCLDTPQQFR